MVTGCATKADLAKPDEDAPDGAKCIMVAKDGASTGLTVGNCSGMMSLTNLDGHQHRELAIWGWQDTPFSGAGDSGAALWYIREGQCKLVGQLHSGSKTALTAACHATYCTPAWWLLDQIKSRYPQADFFPTAWPAASATSSPSS